MKRVVLLLLVVCCLGSVGYASQLEVADGAITTAIENQMPVDRILAYPADYGKLYCFTRIVGAEEPTTISHVWIYQHQEMARVTLAVDSPDWRTYSSKRFLPLWSGDWKVVIEDADGRSIAEYAFRLE